MVLRQQFKNPVWGKAEPGGVVSVEINGQQKKAVADDAGDWQISLDPIPAGGPLTLHVFGADTLVISDVMIGEVWLCSGQSNMEMPLAGWGKVLNFEEEIATADYPDLRLFQVEKTMSDLPATKINCAGWSRCTPQTIPEFSSTAYFFGRMLQQQLNIPVGLIHSSWGGTPAEAWTSGASLKEMPDFAQAVLDVAGGGSSKAEQEKLYREKMTVWCQQMQEKIKAAGGYRNGWENPDLDDSKWDKMQLPTLWEKTGLDVDGIVWFRKEVDLSTVWQGEDMTLSLGPINDHDVTWFNGEQIGSTGNVMVKRTYRIPEGLVRSGKNVIAVQVLDIGNNGGIYGKPEELKLINSNGETMSLAGDWKYMPDPIKVTLDDMPSEPYVRYDAHRPTVLFNGMISPLLPFGISGAIWYQGESNAGRAYQYRTLFPTMITDWRKHWNQGDFPFLFVQLANFMERKSEPADDAWAELREAQLMTLDLPNTGMAVAIDIGDEKDIHPKNKQEVGRRLALNALNSVYGKDVTASGPIYDKMQIEDNKIRISFNHTASGISTPGKKPLKGFAIAGADKKFVWAQAVIEGTEVVVWHPDVQQPVAVRYAWAANPECNLYNTSKLPASPFRTDDWDGITKGKR
ncbi:MAG: 9-O-acetylesterase [Calditrichales bacterium]|nr:MAG: 9-O-acetylesterase [Calditrichales bacterium]